MTDIVTPATRSRMMSGIRGQNTKPEKRLRSILHQAGFRFRLHADELPGKPDLVLPKFRAVIFVHGCFWHRHENCSYRTSPKQNADFWENKLNKNVIRDRRNLLKLREEGWRVAIVWECSLRKLPAEKIQKRIATWLHGARPFYQMRARPNTKTIDQN